MKKSYKQDIPNHIKARFLLQDSRTTEDKLCDFLTNLMFDAALEKGEHLREFVFRKTHQFMSGLAETGEVFEYELSTKPGPPLVKILYSGVFTDGEKIEACL